MSAFGPLAMQRIDPAALWAALSGCALPSWIPLAIAILFVIATAGPARHSASPAGSLRLLAVLGIGLLLAGYHRAYDALLLVPCWLLLALPAVEGRGRWLLAIVSASWVLPGGGFWRALAASDALANRAFVHSPLWSAVVVHLHNWALLLTAVLALGTRLWLTRLDAEPSAGGMRRSASPL